MTVLRASDWYRIAGRGWVAHINNIRHDQVGEDFDFGTLISEGAIIDGKHYEVASVERQGYSTRHFGVNIKGER